MLLLLQGPRCKLLIALQPFQWKSIDRSGHLLRVCWCYHCSHLSSHEEMLAVSLVLIKISQRLLVRITSLVIYWMKFPHPQLCFRGSRPPVDATPGTLLFAASVLFEFLSAPWPDLTWLLWSVHYGDTNSEVKHFCDIRRAAKAALDSKSNELRFEEGGSRSRLSGTQQTVHHCFPDMRVVF